MFLRSFRDSDGDGIGDLHDPIDRLDCLADDDPRQRPNPLHATVNMAAQETDPESLLNLCRSLVRFGNTTDRARRGLRRVAPIPESVSSPTLPIDLFYG